MTAAPGAILAALAAYPPEERAAIEHVILAGSFDALRPRVERRVASSREVAPTPMLVAAEIDSVNALARLGRLLPKVAP